MNEEMSPSDLPIVLYLNQRVTFDLLATLEGGFAQVTNVQESTSNTASSELGGGIGISNAFALLGLTFGAKGKRNKEQAGAETISEQLVHTPSSLFARLRTELTRLNLVNIVAGDDIEFSRFSPGDFVEIRAFTSRGCP